MTQAFLQMLQSLGAMSLTPVVIFFRVSAAMFMMPGFGEHAVPVRIKLILAVMFTLIVWPIASEDVGLHWPEPSFQVIIIEAVIGLGMGAFFRLLVQMLEIAGMIAAQAMSLSQLFGGAPGQDPMPAIGNLLTVSGLALAMMAGLHVKLALALALSYQAFHPGQLPDPTDFSIWGISGLAGAFYKAFSLAGPFVLVSLVYNLALGVINKAMPQLMVAFIGAPAITLAAIILLAVSAPFILSHWLSFMDMALSNPFGDIW